LGLLPPLPELRSLLPLDLHMDGQLPVQVAFQAEPATVRHPATVEAVRPEDRGDFAFPGCALVALAAAHRPPQRYRLNGQTPRPPRAPWISQERSLVTDDPARQSGVLRGYPRRLQSRQPQRTHHGPHTKLR